MPAVSGLARRVFVLLLVLALAGLANGVPRTALAATEITGSDCFDLAAIRTTLEAGGDIVIDCGVVTLDFGSEIVIDSDTTIDGSGTTTLSGGGVHRVIRIDGRPGGVTVTLKRLSIVDGSAGAGGGVFAAGSDFRPVTLHLEDTIFSGNSASGAGGAVYNDGSVFGSATLTATNTTFSDNSALQSGGAVYNYGFHGSVTLEATNTTFSGNSALQSGGAVYNDGFLGSVTLEATNTTFSGNSALQSGGAVYNDGFLGGSATLEVTNTTFSGNSADRGGAVYTDGSSFGSTTLTATNTTFTENSAGIGGAVYNDGTSGGSATLTATNTIFSGNSAHEGGAVENDGFGGHATLTATNTIFSGNSADLSGGAVFNYGAVGAVAGVATLTATNTTFSGNSAGVNGGAVYNYGSVGVATLTATNTTFSGNSADVGGAVYSDGTDGGFVTTTLTATILAGSTGGHCFANTATFTSIDFNLADSTDNSCNLTQPNDQVVASAGLAALADNGGPTQTHALLPTSPAIDVIPAGANGCGTTLTTDQRGIARPQGLACDSGAYEAEVTNVAPSAVDDGPYTTQQDQPLTVTDADGVLANDTDADGDSLSAVLVAGPANGTLTLNLDGSFSYLPDPGFVGPDSFTYQAHDGSADSNVATAAIQVEPAEPGVLNVDIDIKPGSTDNPVNLKSNGVIPVAILSTASFDATTVVPASVCFGDAEDPAQRDCSEAHGKGHREDVNGDGRPDLVLHFETQQTGIDLGDTTACLTGSTNDGALVEGCDVVRVK